MLKLMSGMRSTIYNRLLLVFVRSINAIKVLVFSRIRTQIVRVEGKDADHLIPDHCPTYKVTRILAQIAK